MLYCSTADEGVGDLSRLVHTSPKVDSGTLRLVRGCATQEMGLDEVNVFGEVMEKLVEISDRENAGVSGVTLLPIIKSVVEGDDQTAFLSSSSAIVYADFITRLLPPDLLALTEIDSFQARWREECDEMDFHEIGPFAKDPEAVNILRKIDSRPQERFRSSAKAEAGTTVSSNSAVILLMRIAEFLQAGHATIDENPETAFGIFDIVMDTKDGPRLHFNPAEVRILNKIYGNILGDLCQPDIKTTNARKAPNQICPKIAESRTLHHILVRTYGGCFSRNSVGGAIYC